MEFKELLAAFAAKYGIEGLNDADGVAMLKADDISVELLEDQQTRSVLACAEIGFPPPDADGAFGAMMLQANFLLRGTEGATLCQNPETGAYALVRPFPLALTDVESLGAGIESLVNHVGLRMAEDASSKGLGTDVSHHDMIANGFFHV